MEGAAQAIQMIQARLDGSAHELKASKVGAQLSIPRQMRDAVEPYFVTNILYSTAVRNSRDRDRVSLEDLFVISDTALMYDPLI